MKAHAFSRRDHLTSGRHHWRIELADEHAALQRVLLVFSRRRLRIEALHYALSPDAAELHVDARCPAPEAGAVSAQLRRIVEVLAVAEESDAEEVPVSPL